MFDPTAIDAFLFDLDGTLLDSDDQAVARLTRPLRHLGLKHPDRTARRLVMWMETPINAVLTVLDMVGLDGPLMRLVDWLNRWRGHRPHDSFLLVPGADQVIRALASRYRLAIVTTRGRRDATLFVEQFELTHLFQILVTRETTWRLKPHPAPVIHAAQTLDVDPERCVMIGDTTVDVKSGRRAGALAIGVLCGFGERDELERAGADLILTSPVELLEFIDQERESE